MKPPKNIKTNAQKSSLPDEFLAKTMILADGRIQKGITVFTHCKIVGMVARELLSRIPVWLLFSLFPPGSELVAAVHDVGKISPGFQEKIYRALGLILGLVSPDLDRSIGGHAAVSQAALMEKGDYIAGIAGRHHGASCTAIGFPSDDIYGGPDWQMQRELLVSALEKFFKVTWPVIGNDHQADLLSGLTTVADWIGSGMDITDNDLPDDLLQKKVRDALNNAGFIKPVICRGLSFEEIFTPYRPYPIQEKMIQCVEGPGIYILEAPMGLGKTEAALFAAYKALEENRATGIYFALPTQLTSNRMVDRMNRFLRVILHENTSTHNALLLHGAAWLQQTRMGEEGQPGKSWFDYRKRGLLAPFAVGTIDQALMAVMNVRHGFVRTFGLAGKVVILDEVHCYDTYTGTIIDYLVRTLEKLHCTVIILSATLGIKRRGDILGLKKTVSPHLAAGYPLISARPHEGRIISVTAPAVEEPEIKIHVCGNDEKAIEEALDRAEKGEQVLWLENSVDEAQESFRLLGARAMDLGVECGLLHSRFTRTDREKNEKYWVGLYGKEGGENRCEKGRILVGTQVLEQSLDIDGDFLISRMAPTDMILQRMGRLWRHRSNDPVRPPQARRQIWILSPALHDAVADRSVFGNSAYVYSPYVLCRSLEVWMTKDHMILDGKTIRELIETTYCERREQGTIARYKYEVETTRQKLAGLARVGLSRGGQTLPEIKATTRFSETESVDVLLIRSKHHGDKGVTLCLQDNSQWLIPRNLSFRSGKIGRGIAVALQKNCVSVPEKKAPDFLKNDMGFLKGLVYLGNDHERPFRAALVKESTALMGVGHQDVSSDYKLQYDSVLGYIAEKKDS